MLPPGQLEVTNLWGGFSRTVLDSLFLYSLLHCLIYLHNYFITVFAFR